MLIKPRRWVHKHALQLMRSSQWERERGFNQLGRPRELVAKLWSAGLRRELQAGAGRGVDIMSHLNQSAFLSEGT